MKLDSQPLTPSKLRANIYKYLDEVALKGKTLEIERNGIIIKMTPSQSSSPLEEFSKKRKIFKGKISDLSEISWEKVWKPRSL